MPEKRKIKLKVEPEYDFYLVGIASHENDYRLSWSINKQMGFQFVRADDIVIIEKSIEKTYAHFHFVHENSLIVYDLISNYSEEGRLVPSMANIDYFLKITGELNSSELNDIIASLKKLEMVMSAFHLDLNTIKNPQRFIF